MRSNMTGVGYYNSEPRKFNRSLRRGSPKPFHQSQRHPSPQPPRRGGDLFMEAGRLAVDYLVSRGLLSSNVLSGKSQNGYLRNNSGESDDLRGSEDRDSSRRSSPDQDQRNYRERRRLGPSRSYCSNRTRASEKEGSLTEEAFSSRAIEVNDDVSHMDATSQGTDTVFQAEPTTKNDKHSELQDDTGKGGTVGDLDLKMASLVQNKDDEELLKSSHASKFEDTYCGADNLYKEKDTIMDSLAVQQGEEKSSDSSSKSEPLFMSHENSVCANGLESLDTKNFNAMNGSEEIPSPKTLGSGASDQSIGEAEMVNPGYPVDEQKSIEPLSFAGKTYSCEEKSSGFCELGLLCSSIGKDRGEKRPIEEDNFVEVAKKIKQQWLSVAQSDEYSQLSDLSDKHSDSPAKSVINIFNTSGIKENFTNVSLPVEGCVESDINQGEKQLFSNSFKICDLNLMEAPDMHENHDVSLLYPTMSGRSRDISVDIDLSMRNNVVNEYNAAGSVRKDIEIIDLESTPLEGCKRSNTSVKNTEAGMTTLQNFSNSQNATENRDAQDGYGFMISELLGNEVPNCSSVQPDMNSLHNDMGVNHAEGMFSEDDPIYMSLGEIPLTGLLRAWEQPSQERNPFEL